MTGIKPSILITGANGFVGARLCRFFLDNNFRVVAGVRRNANIAKLDSLDVEYRYGDVTHPETLAEMVAGVDYLIHNAGVVKAKNKETFYQVNEIGTRSLLNAVINHNPNLKKLVYISSQAAAGPSVNNIPVKESDEPRPITTYGRSKLAGERECLSFSDRVHIVSVRPTGIYGPGDREIYSFFQTVNNGIKPYIGNIQRKLQLVHVDDLCRGIFMAVTSDTKSGSVYFIAEKDSYTMEKLISLLGYACNKNGIPIPIPGPIFKALATVSQVLFKLVNATPMLTREKARELLASWEVSTRKANDELGFESEISFENGARETFQWYKKEGWL